MRRRRRQSVLQLRQTWGTPELCPCLLRRGPYYIQCRQQNIVSCAPGGHPQPTPPKARAICLMPSGQRHAARACRTVALPRSRQGPLHWKGEQHEGGARPTSSSSPWNRERGVLSVLERYAALSSPTNIRAEDEGLARRPRRVGILQYRCWSKHQISWMQLERRGGMCALVVMIMLIKEAI